MISDRNTSSPKFHLLTEKEVSSIDELNLIAFPNPFEHEVRLSFYLERESFVKLDIYTGFRQIITSPISDFQLLKKGYHSININGSGWAAGVYYGVLRVDKERKSVTFLKK